jgi:hypothetical protein
VAEDYHSAVDPTDRKAQPFSEKLRAFNQSTKENVYGYVSALQYY